MTYPVADQDPNGQNIRELAELSGDALCLCRDGVIVWLNGAAGIMLGGNAESGGGYESLLGRLLADFFHPDHATTLGGGQALLSQDPAGMPMLLWRKDGHHMAVLVQARALPDGTLAVRIGGLDGTAPAVEALVGAITRLERRARDLSRLSRHNDLAAKVFETCSEGIIALDTQYRVTMVNPAFCEITGWTVPEVIGRKVPWLDVPGDERNEALMILDAARSSGRWQGERWTRRKGGERYAERLGVAAIRDDRDGPVRFVVVFSDITQRKLDEERIQKQANYDTLTGLPNRALFIDRLGQSIHQASRNGSMVGLFFIDLDGFKLINDTMGHDMGDLLLREAGRRLGASVRAGDTVARLGGDEFTALMPNLGNCQNASVVGQRILDELAKPFDLAGVEAFVSGSIGIAIYPNDADDAVGMLKNADAAMYRAKEQGKANFQFYTSDMNDAVEERLAIRNGLLKAFERDELALHFQPKLDLRNRTITGLEALLRWQAADLGSVAPAKFIPVMEEAGLMTKVGDWAIAAACRHYRHWLNGGITPPPIAINLSVRQLRMPGFADSVERALDQAGVPPQAIEFEITEDMVVGDSAMAVATLNRLSAMGIRLSMDDFGTGYSSLSVLKRFPVNSIKIDRTFIADICTDAGSHEIVRTIISMGHSLSRRLIAEGVETTEQLMALERLGCDEIQGYVLAPPLPADQVVAVITAPVTL